MEDIKQLKLSDGEEIIAEVLEEELAVGLAVVLEEELVVDLAEELVVDLEVHL